MLNLRKIAVTGGLSCGKSTVCRILKDLGAYVISADEIVHQLLSPKTAVGQQVINLIGSDVLINDQIDRKKIAKKVFNQPSLLKSLEGILHPAVQAEIEKQYERIKAESNIPLFVAEIPLLFETGSFRKFDFTIAVIADEKICQQRFLETTDYDEEEFKKRSARQLSMQEKAKNADFVILNNGTFAELKENVTKLYNTLTHK